MTASLSIISATADIVVARKDAEVVLLAYTSLGTPDTDEAQRIFSTAVAKLHD